MASEIRIRRVEQNQTKIKTVPIAVTAEGFWCCPSPVGFQKAPKAAAQQPTRKNNPSEAAEKKNPPIVPDEHPSAIEAAVPRTVITSSSRKVVTIEFGETRTSDLKLMLVGRKQGINVELAVHKSVLAQKSSLFADKLQQQEQQNVLDCEEEDVEIYIETIGLMYCKDVKHRLMKQNVSRVLSILKAAERLGFSTCIETCLSYLEAVPWIGEEEEARVISSILHLRGHAVEPVMKRVSAEASTRPADTLSQILELVLGSHDERGRREMKSVVLKLLLGENRRESDLSGRKIYGSFRNCLGSLLILFREASSSSPPSPSSTKAIAFEADNVLWLLEILTLRNEADDFATTWSVQHELASIHSALPVATRNPVSLITARIFVGIGKGEILPDKETRHRLLLTWLQPLTGDYRWLHSSCRSFDRGVVEEGIGRTILTLPLDEQQSVLLSWLGSFLKTGEDSCPNLRKAFEVWWRRTFLRPQVETDGETGKHGKGISNSSSKQRSSSCVGDVLEKSE